MTFFFMVFAAPLPLGFEAISGFYCDEAGKASVDKVIERAIARYCAKTGCKRQSVYSGMDTFEFHSDADFPPFRWPLQ